MKTRIALKFIIVVCLLSLAACGAQPTPAATRAPAPTLEPTSTPQATVTFTPQPTPTSTPTTAPTLTLGKINSVDAGGYSFKIPGNFDAKINNVQTMVSNFDDTILIMMSSAPRKTDSQTIETVLDGFLASIKKDMADFSAGTSYSTTIGKVACLAAPVTGTLFGAKNTGQVTVCETGKSGFFITFAFVVDGANGKRWDTEGKQVSEAIANSVTFFEPILVSQTELCIIASDPNYGYTQEHAIKIGGDAFEGPARERAYLDNLAGPKGEKITYERTGSLDFEDTILDAFVIKGLSKPVTLYIDEYSYTEPQAPVGFTCLAAFPHFQP